ncbi:hypothetical protein K6U06_10545 [Acidiferrimicrobium sp. IK]|uniref:primosomal protein N' family DNA-binding protein n=1 Tax=Acidiferrimicrobium sp. IK TaxID=2871700 RepID=UPI0021CB2E03|nr:hypothetical protein [Acidiferrimicrobium sp. IK]MCU4184797.1 hypothetical protein [Acidiferrimicrobium sp. IK]
MTSGVPSRPGATVVRVAPDVAAIDKEFDYLVADRDATRVAVGTMVRVDLHGRRVGGWVVATGVTPPDGVTMQPVRKVRGVGPAADLLELAGWAAWRWAGRRAWAMATASPDLAVTALPAPRLRAPAPPPGASLPVDVSVLEPGALTVARLGPATDLTPVVAAVAQRGPTLVVVPSHLRASVLAGRLRRAGADVALLPGQWAQARAGAGVVIGARAAAWAPCAGLAAVVVIDGHDEALVQEQAPTWSATAVAAERARRAGVPCLVTSPCPPLELLAAAGAPSARLLSGDPAAERHGWAPVEVIDQRDSDPRLGLWSQRVVAVARGGGRTLVVLNRTGRARLLACNACGDLARCERCGGALDEPGDGALRCPRCGLERPTVCASCGSASLRRLRIGVARAREQLEALVGAPVGEVTAASTAVPDTPVVIGTEAVLHRVERADTVAFVDLDHHLLAPRYRAGEQTLALLARASRLVGGRRRGSGRIVVQTRLPDHPVVKAAVAGDPSILAAHDAPLRAALRLPPVSALAVVSGPGAAGYAAGLQALRGAPVEVLGPDRDRWVVRGPDHRVLCDALASVTRGPGRLRVEVDPSGV